MQVVQSTDSYPELMTTAETAEFLRIPRPTVYYLINKGRVPAVRISGRWRVRRSLLEVVKIGRTVRRLGGRHTEVHEIGVTDGVLTAEHERQGSLVEGAADDRLESGFVNRDFASRQPLDLFGVDVGAHHPVAQVRETGPGRETDVPGTDYCDGARHTTFPADFPDRRHRASMPGGRV